MAGETKPPKMLELLKLMPVEGNYGVEIEVEGTHLPTTLPPNQWRIDQDGSLKGEAYEYVMTKPGPMQHVDTCLATLEAAYIMNGTKVHDTIRAGVHVHVNVQQLTLKQVFTFMTAYYLLEDLLVQWCGENRVGNYFCLRSRDAEFILFQLMQAVETRKLKHLNNDILRYSSLNVCSLFKYGSLEFRAMRGTSQLKEISQWVRILNDIKVSSQKFDDPAEILRSMSGEGEEAILRILLPNTFHLFIKYSGFEDMIRSCARNVQMLAFATDWKAFDKISKNPFV